MTAEQIERSLIEQRLKRAQDRLYRAAAEVLAVSEELECFNKEHKDETKV